MFHQPKVELQEIIKIQERERELEIGGWYGCMICGLTRVVIINVTASTYIYIYIYACKIAWQNSI